jgi:hypothetical protein
MTQKRKIHCAHPDCPHEILLKPHDWIRENLPPSEAGLMVSNIDFVLMFKNNGGFKLLEVKTKHKPIPKYQNDILNIINDALTYFEGEYFKTLKDRNDINIRLKYFGVDYLVFENTFFDDGRVWLNEKLITEDELRKHYQDHYNIRP